MTRHFDPQAAAVHAPKIVDEVVRAPGEPLSEAALAPRLGGDFSQVRVHTGGRAAESARAVGADAYTVGNDIVFGAGRYAPGTSEGDRLLAHELAHVAQHRQSPSAPANALSGRPVLRRQVSAAPAADLAGAPGWRPWTPRPAGSSGRPRCGSIRARATSSCPRSKASRRPRPRLGASRPGPTSRR
ncbi:DUF4157 domain-containing protein [Amycolatopsis saalfeldensis]|uniref:eCIS core domain-containing protein n=1 Tax=Amycolatopsis saalfeldensis TaxID=394193 RepID=UPI000B824130|nr:DUF4157 domain-containing protein [Amycolatopsis saalfeldensis]